MTTTQNSLTTPTSALIVIDMQAGFLDPHSGEPHDLEGCRANVCALISAFAAAEAPIVIVRHDSTKPDSPLRPDAAGNQLFAEVARAPHDLFVTKTVNSAFIGSPDLDAWLRGRGIDTIVLGGIQTNMCVETTARMGGNLGYRVVVALDATTTFPLSATVAASVRTDGITGSAAEGTRGEGSAGAGSAGPLTTTLETLTISAESLIEATAVNLSGGGFAEVTTTEDILARLGDSTI